MSHPFLTLVLPTTNSSYPPAVRIENMNDGEVLQSDNKVTGKVKKEARKYQVYHGFLDFTCRLSLIEWLEAPKIFVHAITQALETEDDEEAKMDRAMLLECIGWWISEGTLYPLISFNPKSSYDGSVYPCGKLYSKEKHGGVEEAKLTKERVSWWIKKYHSWKKGPH